jgi:hypothetical protein
MTNEQISALLERASEWPEEAQAELVQAMIEIEAKYGGVYQLDDGEHAALAESAEDVQLGRFASDEDVAAVFARIRHG